MSDASTPASPVLTILGPTASGKSACALDVAEEFGGTVINADSMQLYRSLRLLTARPSAAEEARVPHRLYGVLSGDDVCSAHRWRALAEAAVREALGEGRLPILCGGTGFYLKAMLEGLSPMPEVPDDVRARVRDAVAAEGPANAHDRLAAIDPQAAARIAPADGQRIARALEVFEASGQTLSVWQAMPPSGPPAGLSFPTVVLAPPREVLVARIERRLEAMMAEGAVEEVRALLAEGLPEDVPIMKAVGVREIARHVRGDWSRPQALEAAVIATRQYAKRQMTWLRRQIIPDLSITQQYSEKSRDEIFAFIRANALTPS